jgi:peptide/nickel transport system ATP-binding protein
MSLLSVHNLTIQFGQESSKPVVNNISFSIEKGEVLGVVGESGSGKSLTGLAIMGLLPNNSHVGGKILFQETENDNVLNLLKLDEKTFQKLRGSKISMIFQEPMTALNPVVKCGRQVQEILNIHSKLTLDEQKTRVIELFYEVMLPDPHVLYNKYPHQLSGGQRQRVMIAMALACNPQLLIADEPTTALDVTVQQSILDLLLRLQKKYGISILFISHDLGVISKISHKILVLRKGEQIEYGDAVQIVKAPQAPYTKGLLACKPKIDRRLKKLPVIDDFLSQSHENIEPVVVSNIEREQTHKAIYAETPILTVKALNTFFKIGSGFSANKNMFHALKQVDIEIWKGETVGIVGESGSGKSTLGRTIMKLVENTNGDIQYKGKQVNNLSKKELFDYRKKIQLVFQDPYSSLNPNHTIGYAISEPMMVHNLVKSKSEQQMKTFELMDLTGLDRAWFTRYPHQLSGGQRQRVVIARALALKPEILICDESVSALDVSIQAQILNLLNDLKKSLGLTYIFISHDLAVVKYMSDRVFVMKQGQIIEHAETDELCSNPQNEYTKLLLNAAF